MSAKISGQAVELLDCLSVASSIPWRAKDVLLAIVRHCTAGWHGQVVCGLQPGAISSADCGLGPYATSCILARRHHQSMARPLLFPPHVLSAAQLLAFRKICRWAVKVCYSISFQCLPSRRLEGRLSWKESSSCDQLVCSVHNGFFMVQGVGFDSQCYLFLEALARRILLALL
uniref:Uncharacterized protein n=1 Tax=Noctiluca scintillans TaxID=2966 RepID=A0A7S1EXT3_NOCSC